IAPVDTRSASGPSTVSEAEVIPQNSDDGVYFPTQRESAARLNPTAASTKKVSARILAAFAALAVTASLAALILYRQTAIPGSASEVKSLAVLPLKNLSGDPAQEYFADGMTESIIARLSMIRGLRVISRTSVMRFKDSKLSIPEIAQTLHVDAIVEG